jgi:methanogenic corrinoid protein MtbC1
MTTIDDFDCGSSEGAGGLAGDPGRRPSATRERSNGKNAQLARTIESEIIPRLMLMHRAGTITLDGGTEQIDGARPTDSDVRELAIRSYTNSVDEVWHFVRSVQQRGIAADAIDLELLAPAARLLGDFWTQDECDFTQVTVGLSRLRQVLHRLEPEFAARAALDRAENADPRRRILLAPAPGEQHTFGLMIVGEFLRREGWVVREPMVSSLSELVSYVRNEPFGIVALSAACDSRLDDLTTVIATLRRASVTQPLGVMVGGPLFSGHADRVARVGADGTAVDAREAPLQAQKLLRLITAKV